MIFKTSYGQKRKAVITIMVKYDIRKNDCERGESMRVLNELEKVFRDEEMSTLTVRKKDLWDELKDVLQVLKKNHTTREILAASVKILYGEG